MTIAAMIDAAGATGDGLIEWAPRVQPDDTVEITWDGMARAVPKTILLTQAINHATEHPCIPIHPTFLIARCCADDLTDKISRIRDQITAGFCDDLNMLR